MFFCVTNKGFRSLLFGSWLKKIAQKRARIAKWPFLLTFSKVWSHTKSLIFCPDCTPKLEISLKNANRAKKALCFYWKNSRVTVLWTQGSLLAKRVYFDHFFRLKINRGLKIPILVTSTLISKAKTLGLNKTRIRVFYSFLATNLSIDTETFAEL